jgi:hypothetical protein
MHAGVEWLRPTDGPSIKVAAARELADRLGYAPFEGDVHLVVIDPADALTDEAFNALLKAIEEPVPGVVFALIGHNRERILPTIRSRCLPVALGYLDAQATERVVRERLESAGDVHDSAGERAASERLAVALQLATGSPGRALELCRDDALAPTAALLHEAARAAMHGPKAIFAGDRDPLWQAWEAACGTVKTGRSARQREVLARLCELWLLYLRNRLRGAEAPIPTPRQAPTIVAHMQVLQSLLEQLARNPNPRLALEGALLGMHP